MFKLSLNLKSGRLSTKPIRMPTGVLSANFFKWRSLQTSVPDTISGGLRILWNLPRIFVDTFLRRARGCCGCWLGPAWCRVLGFEITTRGRTGQLWMTAKNVDWKINISFRLKTFLSCAPRHSTAPSYLYIPGSVTRPHGETYEAH